VHEIATAVMVRADLGGGKVLRLTSRGMKTALHAPDGWTAPGFDDVDWAPAEVSKIQTQAWPGYVPIPERWSRVDWIAYVLPSVVAVAVAGLMLIRRRQPILVFALAVVLLLVDTVRGSGIGTVSLAMLIATYGLGRLGTPRRDVTGLQRA